ncbi:MAG TPA: NAD(P)-binding protein [Acidimicrobiales bacterium]|nr:NAD(P)-binding protein [Acidimicrobiales bacterium]
MMEKPFAITLDVGSSLANKTGSWRVQRPVYVDRLPPCNHACPAGEDIQGWLYLAEDGSDEAAWRQIMLDNPLPAVMGRACFHPCQTACNRATVDEAVGINAVERFLGDRAIAEDWKPPPPAPDTGRRVMVVGSGPGGLSAAYHLRLMGHSVVIFEAAPLPGGMMRYGIPSYRLPRDIVSTEIDRIVQMGVEIRCGHSVDDLRSAMDAGGFEAAFLAVGAQRGRHADIPAGDSAHVLDAVALLKGVDDDVLPALGRRVVVYGGGNTAMDAARTARRLGAEDAVVIYRRTRDLMPANADEVQEAAEEGVRLQWLSTVAGAGDGSLTIEKMALDETGFPQPTGQFEHLEADTLVLALGQESDLTLLRSMPDVRVHEGNVHVDADMMTDHPGVFAGGDMVAGGRTLTDAIGHGKLTARAIDAWLRGSGLHHSPSRPLATVDRLNTWYYSDAPVSVRPRLDAARRASTFDEVIGGLDEDTAGYEARRCLSCGNCFQCDNCFGVCPDNAVMKISEGHGYQFNYDFCKGCGLCAQECPCGAIDMVAEEI